MSSPETWRNQAERRYQLDRERAITILRTLNEHLEPMVYHPATLTSLVATVYFDTPDGRYHASASEQDTPSVKIRAREYFPVSDTLERRILERYSKCFLERKLRTGTVREKTRIRIDKRDLAGIIEHRVPVPPGVQDLADEISAHTLVPALISVYERRVWGGDHSDLRITFDERVRYYIPPQNIYETLTALAPDELGEPDAHGPKRLLEIKHQLDLPLPSWLDELIAGVPEARGFSKFLDGMGRSGSSGGRRGSLTKPVFDLD